MRVYNSSVLHDNECIYTILSWMGWYWVRTKWSKNAIDLSTQELQQECWNYIYTYVLTFVTY